MQKEVVDLGQLVSKSFIASFFIALGCYVLLKIGNPIGPFLFALGLLMVCYSRAYLFTGKCGFFIEEKLSLLKLLQIFCVNVIGGMCAGVLIGMADNSLIELAQQKVNSWSWSTPFFLQSVFCGIIMYVAVDLYKLGTNLGILLGVPLFIFAGMQHSIANSVFYGIAGIGDGSPLWLCALGNFVGSICTWILLKGGNNENKKC